MWTRVIQLLEKDALQNIRLKRPHRPDHLCRQRLSTTSMLFVPSTEETPPGLTRLKDTLAHLEPRMKRGVEARVQHSITQNRH